jgi:hypothetical protein
MVPFLCFCSHMAFCFADRKNRHRTLSWQRLHQPLNLILSIASQILIQFTIKMSLFLQGGRMNCSSKECPVTCSSNEDTSECCKICTGQFNLSLKCQREKFAPLNLQNIFAQQPFYRCSCQMYSCNDESATFSLDSKAKYNKRYLLLS